MLPANFHIKPELTVASFDRQAYGFAGDINRKSLEELTAEQVARLKQGVAQTTALDPYHAIAGASGDLKSATEFYVAVQYLLAKDEEKTTANAKALDIRGHRNFFTPEQAFKVLGIEYPGDDIDRLRSSLPITEEERDKFKDVAKRYLANDENYYVIANWLKGAKNIDFTGEDIDVTIERGIEINAAEIAANLKKEAERLKPLDPAREAEKTTAMIEGWLKKAPYAFFPKTLEALGFTAYIAMGQSFAPLFEDAFPPEKDPSARAGFRSSSQARGVAMPALKTIFSTTHRYDDQTDGSLSYNQWGARFTLMQEMFHAVDSEPSLQQRGGAYRSSVIDTTIVHNWVAALKNPDRVQKLEKYLAKAGSKNPDNIAKLHSNLDQYLLVSGAATKEALTEKTLAQKIHKACTLTLELPKAYENSDQVSRATEIMVRYHEAMFMVFRDFDTGADCTRALKIMMPELDKLYQPMFRDMKKREQSLMAENIFDRARFRIENAVEGFKENLESITQRISGRSGGLSGAHRQSSQAMQAG